MSDVKTVMCDVMNVMMRCENSDVMCDVMNVMSDVKTVM